VGHYSLSRSNRQNPFEIADFRHPGVWLETCDGSGCVKGRKLNRQANNTGIADTADNTDGSSESNQPHPSHHYGLA
jgi:hypothetical protein